MNQRLEFGERLHTAMMAVGLEPRPGVLLNLFNSKYWGRSVSFQAVSRWLRGEAIPEQDKLLVLAEILHMEPEVLRFGEGVRRKIAEHRQRWEDGVGYLERETFDAFLQLPPAQRKMVREIIMTFANAKTAPEETPSAPEAKPAVEGEAPPAA